MENLLHTLETFLVCSEEIALDHFSNKDGDFPIVFVMGPLRSGTTLFMQWLANTGLVAYPTNLLSRFYASPVVGAHIQLLLTDPRFNFRDEIQEFITPISFNSENGKTKGALSPNEFWYFWRRFLPFKELDWLPDEELFRVVDREKLVAELTSLTKVFNKPFALKSMILNYNIPFLNSIFKKALFIQINRDPVANVASILDARKRQLGSEDKWYSFKIPEYSQLQGLDPVVQAAGQLHYNLKAVNNGLLKVNDSRKMAVQYENFCKHPEQVFEELIEKLNLTEKEYRGAKQFKLTRRSESQPAIEKALRSFLTK